MNLKEVRKIPGAGLYFLAFFLVFLCVGNSKAQVKVVPDTAFSHIMYMVKNNPDPKIPVEPVPGSNKSSLVTNRGKTFKAFVLCVPVTAKGGACESRVFVTDNRTKTTYVIAGEPGGFERYRVIDELKWIGKGKLGYERWATPHFGHRYVIDVSTRKQTAAFTLSDGH